MVYYGYFNDTILIADGVIPLFLVIFKAVLIVILSILMFVWIKQKI